MELTLLPNVFLRPGENATNFLPYTSRRRVHWGDGDAALIAYTARFVDFAMEALDGWWETILDTHWYGLRCRGGGSPMVSMAFDFIHPIRPGDRVNCRVDIEALGTSSLTAKIVGFTDDETEIFQSRLTSVYLHFARQKSQPFPAALRERILRYQADSNLSLPGLAAPEAILNYWFGDPGSPERDNHRPFWFGQGEKNEDAIDAEIRAQFATSIVAAQAGQLTHWRQEPRATLAQLLLLDQFSRNVYRGDAQAFAGDALAREVAHHAIARGDCAGLPLRLAMFYFLPFEHSELLADQNLAVDLFSRHETRDDEAEAAARIRDYAIRHQEVIARFGRFPHRNKVLGRASTAEEFAFLQEPNSSF